MSYNSYMPADIALVNARVVTMDPAMPAAELVAVAGGRITAVGPGTLLYGVAGPGTRVIDCAGRTLVPGFNDAHLHMFSLVQKLLSIDVSPTAVSSIAEIKEAVRRQAARTPPGTWLRGSGYNEFYLDEGRCPTRRDLDEAAPHHPVVLSHRSLHAVVLNSRALELAGIGPETPEPPGGRIERDLATGEPNGLLIGIQPPVPSFSGEEFDEGVRLLDRQLLAYGITSFQDATYKNDIGRWRTLRGLKDSGRLRPRVTMMAGPETRREFEDEGMTTGFGDSGLRLGAVKFLLDVHPDREWLNAAALECHRAGWQLAFHAVAESTVAAAVSALEYIDGHSPIMGRRHRIEHCGECPPALLERLRRLGAVIVTQPAFIYYSGERYLATVDPTQLPWLYRLRAPLEAGVVVAGSSDAPVAPYDPLMGIHAAVNRRAESGQPLLPGEAVSPEQAMRLYTVNAACTTFEENIKGSISPGKLADVVLLSEDPTTVPPERLRDIQVMMTMIGGEVVWEA